MSTFEILQGVHCETDIPVPANQDKNRAGYWKSKTPEDSTLNMRCNACHKLTHLKEIHWK